MIPNGRKFWGFTILAGAALSALFWASLLRRPPVGFEPTLPTAVQEAVKHEALEWGSTASIVGLAAGAQIAWLDSEEAVQDEARLIEVCDNLAAASTALVGDFRRRAASAAGAAMGVDQIHVERFFRQTLREMLPRDPKDGAGQQDDVYFQLPAVPLHSFILSAPALAPPNPVLQRILERLLQVLTRLVQLLPPDSPAVAAVQRAIDAILALLGTTDTAPPQIQNLLPANGALTSDSTPTITGSVTDVGGAGVDVASVMLRLDGALVSPSTTLVNADRLDFSFSPSTALNDGTHSIAVEARDLAGNPAASVSTSFVIDATPPVIGSRTPADGSTVPDSMPLLAASWTDATSGIDVASARVRLDGATLAMSATAAGFSLVSAPLAPGTHTLSIQVSDLAGNTTVSEGSFTVPSAPGDTTAPVLSEWTPSNGAIINDPEPRVSVAISDVEGSGVDTGSVAMTINGALVVATVVPTGPGAVTASFKMPPETVTGTIQVSVDVRDLAGNGASGSVVFTVDTFSPRVELLSPADGETVGGASLVLSAAVSDSGVGVFPASIRVRLNGVDITSLLTLSPGPLTPYGFSAQVGLSGALTPSPGPNSLVIEAADGAANDVVYPGVFFVDGAGGGSSGQVSISKVSGDGQIGMTTFVSDLLKIRVTVDGVPAKDIPVRFTRESGDGLVVLPEGTDPTGLINRDSLTRTDGGGEASMAFMYGDGPAVVSALVLGQQDLKVSFSLEGRLPTLQEEPLIHICNPFPSTSDFEGSGVRKILRLRLRDKDGNPIARQNIEAKVLPEGLGYFLPSEGFTDGQGLTKFGFVINDGMPEGAFTLRFTAPLFLDRNGQPVKVDVGGSVYPNPRNPQINRQGGASGQGQIVEPGQQATFSLRAKTDQFGGFITFQVLEGDGEITGVAEGSLSSVFVTTCPEHPMWLVAATNEGNAAVTYRKGSTRDPELVDIGQGSDTFVIGAPETLIVEETSPGSGAYQSLDMIRMGLFRRFIDGSIHPEADNRFFVETRRPINGAPATSRTVRALSVAGNPAASSGAFLAPTSVTVAMSQKDDVQGRYRRFVSEPLMGLRSVARYGETPTAISTAPGGEKVIQIAAARGVVVEGQDPPAERVKEARVVLPDGAFTCVGGIFEPEALGRTAEVMEFLVIFGKPQPGDVTIEKGEAKPAAFKDQVTFKPLERNTFVPFSLNGADAFRANPADTPDPMPEGGMLDVDIKIKGKKVGSAMVVSVPQLWVRMCVGEFGRGAGSLTTRHEEIAARSAVLGNRRKSPRYPNKSIEALVTIAQFEGAFNTIGTAAKTPGGLLETIGNSILTNQKGHDKGATVTVRRKPRFADIYSSSVLIGGMYYLDLAFNQFEGSLAFISPRGFNLSLAEDQVSVFIRVTQNAAQSSEVSFADILKLIKEPVKGDPPKVDYFKWDRILFPPHQGLLMEDVVVERLVLFRPSPAGDTRTFVNQWDQIFEDNEAATAADRITELEFFPKR